MSIRTKVGFVAIALSVGCGQQSEEEVATAEQLLCSASCLCNGPGDAYANSRGTGGSCAHDMALLPSPINSAIEVAGDYDWFRFTTTSNSGYYTYRFNTDRPNGAVSTTDTYCDIYQTATSPYAMRYNNNDTSDLDPVTGGVNCMVTLATNLASTTYYLRVRHSNLFSGTGAYALSMTSGPSGVGDPCTTNADCPGGTCILDACTAALPDADNDGFPDDLDGVPEDNCTNIANPDQADCDLDGTGDACDATDDSSTTGGDCTLALDLDADDDGLDDDADNCPSDANSDQANFDGDDYDANLPDTGGDACDIDDDGDGAIDSADNCLWLSNTDQADFDRDGAGDACDSDDDNDTVGDDTDNCPLDANTNQADYDMDGLGNACDSDGDNDGVDNADDLCPDSPGGKPVGHTPESNGCTGSQLIALLCPCNGSATHGDYVSCVSHAADKARNLGLIANNEHGRHVRAAAQSSCPD